MWDDKELLKKTDNLLDLVEKVNLDSLDINGVKKIYKDLIDVINYHNWLYYVKASPVISDWQYDKLFAFLKKIEQKFPELIRPDSPTQRLNVPIQEEFKKEKHKMPLLSLDNSYNPEDIKQWAEFVIRNIEPVKKELNLTDNISYHVEPKFDGSSVELVYEYWIFKKAITRWDWLEWEDVTENVKTIYNLPLVLDKAKNIKQLRLRWEVLMPKTSFERINKERAEKWLPLFANPRNAAAWSLRQLDPKQTAKRWLVIYVYDLLYLDIDQNLKENLKKNVKLEELRNFVSDENELLFESLFKLSIFLDKDFTKISQDDVIKFFIDIWLPVFWWEKIANSVDELINICTSEDTLKFFENQDIEFDWLVIKVNNLWTWPVLWMTAHHPRWAIAYKFPAKQVVTKLLSVDFQVGRTGIITPVANLQPVEIWWVTVSRATLHNFDFIKEKDIRIWDWVWVIRSWEVIPYVVNPVVERRNYTDCIEINWDNVKKDLKNIDLTAGNKLNLKEAVKIVYKNWLKNFEDNIEFKVSDRWKKDIICYDKDALNIDEVLVENINLKCRDKFLRLIEWLVNKWILIKILPPNCCPVCWSEVVKFVDEVYYYCSNINCPAQLKERLKYFVSKDCMDIEWLWDKLIDMLVDSWLVKHYADLYLLKLPQNKAKLLSLPLMGYKRVEDLLKQIEESKNRYLWRLINALGIRYVWKKTSKLLEKAIFLKLKKKAEQEASKVKKDWIKILEWLIDSFDREQLINLLTDEIFVSSIYGIWEKTVKSLKKYLTEPKNIDVIKQLYEVWVKFNIFEEFEEIKEADKEKNKPLVWIHFSITWKFPITRSKLVEILQSFWAEWDEQPKKTTNFILVWQDPGSKLQKAQKYGIEIIVWLENLIKKYPFLENILWKYKKWLF